ncbi:MAG: cytochrome c3 family protein [Pseudomonadota bacterium]
MLKLRLLRSFAMVGALALAGIFLPVRMGSATENQLAPGDDAKALSSHAPYISGQCAICHEAAADGKKSGKSPGTIAADVNALCATCHEDMEKALISSRVVHAPVMQACTICHNPHNSTNRSLLLAEGKKLCLDCHGEILKTITEAKVQHKAVIEKGACMNCHTPHASNIQHLLTKLPFDLCVACHSEDNKVDANGRQLSNFSKLLANNPFQHEPVKNKDCSACHLTHGSNNPRLLVAEYPALFYSPYTPANYALCYRCHNNQNMADPETTTTTRFRDGSRNLHYLHVNRTDKGRTCRACHEVHASKNPHQLRDGVPFGPRNWVLPINYTKTKTGGSCAKTCHQTKTYDHTKK